MFTSDDMLGVYRDLADYHERQGLDQLRDRFLVLAAAAAHTAGQNDEAERLRQRLLNSNGSHLLLYFASMAQALHSPDVQTYVEDLRQEYPPRAAEDLLASVRGPARPARRHPTRALPPTAPVIDLDSPVETLKVYAHPEEPGVPTLPAWEDPPPRRTSFPSARPSKLLPATASARPATVPVKRLAAREPSPQQSRRAVSEPIESEEAGGRWVGLVLFVVVLAAALYLAGITLLQPFLP